MITWSEFRQLISQYFDAEELRILCFDLDIDYDNLPGERKGAKKKSTYENFYRYF